MVKVGDRIYVEETEKFAVITEIDKSESVDSSRWVYYSEPEEQAETAVEYYGYDDYFVLVQ